MGAIKLKRREGADGYFVNDQGRLQILNKSLFANRAMSVVGLVKENEGVWFVRSGEMEDGDMIWVEATFAEVQEYQRTGNKDFLKTDLVE